MKNNTEIHWNQAQQISKEVKASNKTEFKRLLEEIENSNPTVLDYNDFAYYASKLNSCNATDTNYESNDIRRIMMTNYNCNPSDMLENLIGSDQDDIFDFY